LLFKHAKIILFLVEFIVYIILFVVVQTHNAHSLIFVEAPMTQDTPDNLSNQHLHQRIMYWKSVQNHSGKNQSEDFAQAFRDINGGEHDSGEPLHE
jgi:hypothetical protein